jgi:hypothetical protein
VHLGACCLIAARLCCIAFSGGTARSGQTEDRIGSKPSRKHTATMFPWIDQAGIPMLARNTKRDGFQTPFISGRAYLGMAFLL